MIFIMCAVCAYVQLVHALCVMCVVFGGGIGKNSLDAVVKKVLLFFMNE